ncbi:MAG: hypothetical protein R6U64_07875, partial [Bacteroidales bacterium]
MDQQQIQQLKDNGALPEAAGHAELIQTHISWLILYERVVYKIKKPVQYSFVDFSTAYYLFGLYLLGVAGFLFHLLAGHFNAIRMVQKSSVENLFGSRVHITKKDVHPF